MVQIDESIGIALVGYGYWGPNIARNLYERPEFELLALCELDPDRAGAFARRFPGISINSEFDKVLLDPRSRRSRSRRLPGRTTPSYAGRSRPVSTCSSRSLWPRYRPRRPIS